MPEQEFAFRVEFIGRPPFWMFCEWPMPTTVVVPVFCLDGIGQRVAVLCEDGVYREERDGA